ncbi:Ser-Thr-rich GPI-anchored membrane family protein [Fulvivirgaceae bacterium BMA12]|uniref:Ser-Thr-rich GPI-anchored membrane family protein n=1 Tax=Agaribacillus aureus TaxID=3051825 RepID=A0ABT8L161_9BACT|nr:Ser-Thr-rich GPI-anchored membrane family protein [Fulvivirgaceae bacterium BMA12]
MIRRITAIICFFMLGYQAQGQIIENFRQEIIGDEVNIYFDLIANIEGQIFEVVLYCSDSSTYSQRLYFASGDVGKNVKPGKNKKVVWTNKEELTTYSLDQLTFEIKANIQSSSLYFIHPRDRNTVFKRGTTEKIEWLGGDINESLVIELYRFDVREKVISNTSNKGNTPWNIPLNLRPGVDYQLKMSVANKPSEPVFSTKFQIRRRIPNALKFIPAGIIAGVVTFLIANKEPNNELPGPPGPPN